MSVCFRPWSLVVGLALLAQASRPALAMGAGERQVAGEISYAMEGGGSGVASGVRLGAEYALGLSDSWGGWGLADYTWYPAARDDSFGHAASGALGVRYSVDITRLVPFVDVGVLLQYLRVGPPSTLRLGPQVAAGGDYLLSRHWTLGARLSFDYPLVSLAGNDDPRPWRLLYTVRVSRVF